MPEETKELLRQLDADTVALRDAVARLKRWLRRFVAAFLIAVLSVGYVLWRDQEFRDCTQSWAGQFTDRSNALSGSSAAPGNARIDLFFQAYTDAAGAKHKPLTAAERRALISGLDADRSEFSVIPKHAELAKSPEPQLLALTDLVAALRANAAYHRVAQSHPVPTAPTCGGIF